MTNVLKMAKSSSYLTDNGRIRISLVTKFGKLEEDLWEFSYQEPTYKIGGTPTWTNMSYLYVQKKDIDAALKVLIPLIDNLWDAYNRTSQIKKDISHIQELLGNAGVQLQ